MTRSNIILELASYLVDLVGWLKLSCSNPEVKLHCRHDKKWVKLKSKIGRIKSKIGGKLENKGKAK